MKLSKLFTNLYIRKITENNCTHNVISRWKLYYNGWCRFIYTNIEQYTNKFTFTKVQMSSELWTYTYRIIGRKWSLTSAASKIRTVYGPLTSLSSRLSTCMGEKIAENFVEVPT